MSSLDAVANRTRVRDLMSKDLATIAPEAPLSGALTQMVRANVGSLVVTRHTGPGLRRADILGLLPVFFALRASVGASEDVPVDRVAVQTSIMVRADETIGSVLARMTNNETWRLIVLDGDDVVGLISATDIVRLFSRTERENDE